MILHGTELSNNIQLELAEEIKKDKLKPQLTAILVGNDPASQIYVNKKIKACNKVGIKSEVINITCDNESQIDNAIQVLKQTILQLNDNTEVNGILLQLPLPYKIEAQRFFNLISPWKDVDVLNPENVGLLVQHCPRFKPCTPHGIQLLLKHYNITTLGAKVCVISRSNIVGKPLSSMLIQDCDIVGNATVTVCHDKTPPNILKEITSNSDIVVVAVGIPNFLTVDMIKHGSTVIDVGVFRKDDKIYGDADFENISKIANITPCVGGVGPMTIAMLLYNTVQAYKMQKHIQYYVLQIS